MDINDCKILICDDSVFARRQIKNMLSRCGNPEILEAKDGKQAMDLIKEFAPDIMFLDICMPNVDGKEVIKAGSQEKNLPYTIIVSSVGTKDNLKEVLTHGAKNFIQKPIVYDDFVKIVNKALDEI